MPAQRVRSERVGTTDMPNTPSPHNTAAGRAGGRATRLGSGEELAFTVMECITNPYLNGETIRVDGGIRMPPK